MSDILKQLAEVLAERKNADPESSYVAKLHSKGLDAILKKVGEEATEVIVAALAQSDEELAEEMADLVYHSLVLLQTRNVQWADVINVLEKRHS